MCLGPVTPLLEGQVDNLEWVTCPARNQVPQAVDLTLPLPGGFWTAGRSAEGIGELGDDAGRQSRWLLLTRQGRMNQEEIDVARLVAVTSRGGAEDARVQGPRPPTRKFFTESPPQLGAKVRKHVSHTGRDVLAVELMDQVAAHHCGVDNALLDQPREAAPDSYFGPSHSLIGDLADRKRLACNCEHRENRTVQGRGDTTCRIR